MSARAQGGFLRVGPRVRIPLAELRFSFSRSSGAGGQNVNKVNTKATLRWDVLASPSLPAAMRERFATRFRRRITARGELQVSSQRYRDQGRNVADCLEKLRAMLLEVAAPRAPRRPTRPTRSAAERRLRGKRRRSEAKARRRRPGLDES
ncbi:MAG: aminoacyl-tRNA hydrolase [Deltaproteobacteria bacterium]|nr:MAG: aminoacyl-tRNA hydrolase [Deltaproteobacteria bacterium]